MTKPKTARERFVEAMRVMLASEFCCGTLDKNHAEAACDAFADAECEDTGINCAHDICRMALRIEVFGE